MDSSDMDISTQHSTYVQSPGADQDEKSDEDYQSPDVILIEDTSLQIVRDSTYYVNGGDCIILVDNTLFKIHRFLLARDSSAFENMVSLPQGDSLPDGLTEDHPIVLYDDVDDFRALCWALYALPTELEEQSDAALADLYRVVRIVRMSNKYHFSSYEKWSLNILTKICSGPRGRSFISALPAMMIAQIQKIAILCNSHAIHAVVFEAWYRQLEMNRLTVVEALSIAERYGVRSLQGLAYYRQVVEMSETSPLDCSTITVFELPQELTQVQQIRLLRGYCSLSNYRDVLKKFDATMRCKECSAKTGRGCETLWARTWDHDEEPFEPAPMDLFEKLRIAHRYLQNPLEDERPSRRSCRSAALLLISCLETNLKSDLAGHFLGPQAA